MRLDDHQIRRLTPPLKGQKLYRDDTLTGFACRVSQGGTKTFVLIHGPERQFISIGRYPIISLAEARAEARRLLAEKTLGKVRPQSITVPAAIEVFLTEKRKSRRPSTVANLEDRLERHFNFKGQLADVTHQDIARKLAKIKSNSEHDHALAVAKTFFTWCHNRRYINDNPVRGLTPHGSQSRSRVLSDAELRLVWIAAEQMDSNFAIIVKLLVLTGQRRGEIAALRTDYISNDTICLPSSLTKNGREHTFPISSLTNSILASHITKTEPTASTLLFPARGKLSSSFNGWSKTKSQLDQLSGVSGWTLHDLRRTFATRLSEMGTPPHVVERLLNHVTGQISGVAAVYNRASYMAEMKTAVDKWEAHLKALLQLP